MAAEKKEDKEKKLDDLVSQATNKTGTGLDDDLTKLGGAIDRISADVMKDYGSGTPGGNVLSFYGDLNFKDLYDAQGSNGKTGSDNSKSFKDSMEALANSGSVGNLLIDQSKVVEYENYAAIVKLIPECALGVETYVSNIVSPDDYTKTVFVVNYIGSDQSKKSAAIGKVIDLTKKYRLDQQAEKIVEKAITLGDYYIAVVPYGKEIQKMLDSNSSSNPLSLNESAVEYDQTATSDELKPSDIMFENANLSRDDSFRNYIGLKSLTKPVDPKKKSAINEDASSKTDPKEILESINEVKSKIAEMVNTNVKVGSAYEMLTERIAAENESGIHGISDIDTHVYDIPSGTENKTKGKLNDDPLKNQVHITGSSVRELKTEKVVPLQIDSVCYGYYYVEYDELDNNSAQSYGPSIVNPNNSVSNSMTGPIASPVSQTGLSSSDIQSNMQTPAAQMLNVSDDMLRFLSGVVLSAVSKKIDKGFVNGNKDLKDIIYQLLRQDYIRKKQIRITYFPPDEVVHFKTDSIFKNVGFFAKIYVSTLYNDFILKMGRAHDKRVFYVNVGPDKNGSAAVQETMRDIKSKEYSYGTLGTLSNVLTLAPGRFDDYYIPVAPDGSKPVDIETLPGMNQDNSDELLKFCKDSIINGIGLPSAVVTDQQQNIEFARMVSAQNINFLRRVIRKQLALKDSFTKYIRLLYRNEYIIEDDQNEDTQTKGRSKKQPKQPVADPSTGILPSDIEVSFPSPASLNMTNIVDLFNSAKEITTDIVDTLIPLKDDNSNKDARDALSTLVMKDQMPTIDWIKYEKMIKESTTKVVGAGLKEDRKAKASGGGTSQGNPFGG